MLVVGCVAGLLAWAGAEGAQKPLADKQVLRVGLEAVDVPSLDPHFITTSPQFPITKDIFNSLVRFKAGRVGIEEIEPDLAESWTVSQDGLVWTFKLRKGVKWHKGFGELTSEDVKFSLDRVRNPETGTPWTARFTGVTKIETPDKYTVRSTLKTPDPFFLSWLGDDQSGFIISKEAFQRLKADFKNQPGGTGPFVFQEYRPKERVVVVRNDEYFRGKPTLERVEFLFMPNFSTKELALRKGDIHMMRGKREQVWVERIRKEGIIVDSVEVSSTSLLHFNMTQKPLDDLRVRKAIAHAINKAELLTYAGKAVSEVQVSPLPHTQFGGVREGIAQYDYDPKRAKELLAEAGYPNGFAISTMVTEREDYRTHMEVIQEQLRRVGIKLDLKVVDHSTYHTRSREDANPLVLYLTAPYPAADVLLTQFFHSKAIVGTPTGVTNFSHYNKIDDIIDKSRVEMNPEKQKALYVEAQRRIMEDLPAYPTLLRKIVLARVPYVDLGYDMQSTVMYHYIHETVKILKP